MNLYFEYQHQTIGRTAACTSDMLEHGACIHCTTFKTFWINLALVSSNAKAQKIAAMFQSPTTFLANIKGAVSVELHSPASCYSSKGIHQNSEITKVIMYSLTEYICK